MLCSLPCTPSSPGGGAGRAHLVAHPDARRARPRGCRAAQVHADETAGGDQRGDQDGGGGAAPKGGRGEARQGEDHDHQRARAAARLAEARAAARRYAEGRQDARLGRDHGAAERAAHQADGGEWRAAGLAPLVTAPAQKWQCIVP
eukprot:scaffold88602_cov64-Phaeocystis_antarctica.AAC.8